MGEAPRLPESKSADSRVLSPGIQRELSRLLRVPPPQARIPLRKQQLQQECELIEPVYAFCLVDPAMRFTQASPAMAELTGYSIEELGHMGIQEIIALESLESAMEAFEQVDRFGWSHYASRFYRKDGVAAEIRLDLIQLSEELYLAWVREVRVPKGALLTV